MVVKSSICTCMVGHSSWETDHKPLQMISLKNLTAAPAHLQRILHLQQYDLVIMYWPGRGNASGRCPQPPPIQSEH